MIRPAEPSESEDLRAIDRGAAARYVEVGMAGIAEDEPMSAAQFEAYAVAGRSWVATDDDDRPVGYVLVDILDGRAHIEQVSVAPSHQGHGLGRKLIAEVEHWARGQGMNAVTLTTFRDVPWNRPLYEHLGFHVLADDEIAPGLREQRAKEADRGLDPVLRVCMAKSVWAAAEYQVQLRHQSNGSGPTCREILAALPHWFGIPESIEDYARVADRSLTVVASVDGRDVGFLTVVRHTDTAAEVYVMGVLPEFHRQGLGTKLLGWAEELLAADGVMFLQVKTLGPSRPDEGYERTRAFYAARGFHPLEEFWTLWDAGNPALQMIKVLITTNNE